MRRKISASGRVKIAIFASFYVLLHLSTRWFALTQVDKGRIVYEYERATCERWLALTNTFFALASLTRSRRYETPPGIALQYSRVFAALWFAYACYTTQKDFPNNKRRFYKKYSLVFGLWFLWMVIAIWITS